MALTISTLLLASGLQLNNPLIVISELNVSNNTSTSERLDVIDAPNEGDSTLVNQSYSINTTNNGGRYANYMVSIFLNQDAFDQGKLPIEKWHESRQVKVFSINLNEEQYQDLTPRQSAYQHLGKQEEFIEAEEIEDLEV